MKTRTLVGATALTVVLIATSTVGALAAVHNSAFQTQVNALKATWDRDQADGVPAASLAPLRAELQAKEPPQQWWQPDWVASDHTTLVSDLEAQTSAAYSAALAAAQGNAEAAIATWSTFATQQKAWITSDATATAEQWPTQLSATTRPADADALTNRISAFTATQTKAVKTAQTAKLNSELSSAGGPRAILATAKNLEASALSANLDDSSVGSIAATLQRQLNTGVDPTATAQQLVAAIDSLDARMALNDHVAALVRPLMLSVDQAAAEGTPNASALQAQYATVAAAFRSARTSPELNAVVAQVTTAATAVKSELSAHQCGHSVGSGKVITVNLTLQEMVFYQNGCVANAAPTTTGRPQLPTPTGTFHVFYKTSPFHMISPWPVGSPYYYYPTWVQQVMEFDSGGYFIHDAYWEPPSDFGPGSEDIPAAASHGCIHIPTPMMEWAYTWTPVGTPVIVSA